MGNIDIDDLDTMSKVYYWFLVMILTDDKSQYLKAYSFLTHRKCEKNCYSWSVNEEKSRKVKY